MSTAINEHTGDKIQSKKNSDAYRDNYDKIFYKRAENDKTPKKDKE